MNDELVYHESLTYEWLLCMYVCLGEGVLVSFGIFYVFHNGRISFLNIRVPQHFLFGYGHQERY